MLIKGYLDGPLVAGESLLDRPGFWSSHLMAMCGDGACAERPVPEWFGDDGADVDALSEVLFDPERWPVFRVPAEDGPGAVVIYRNLVGDYGTDYLLIHPDSSRAQRLAGRERAVPAIGLTWHELVRIADNPSAGAEGAQHKAVRLLLLLPLLADADLPEAARERITVALTATCAPQDTAATTAEHLLAHLERRPRHDPTWESPLSGGPTTGRRSGTP